LSVVYEAPVYICFNWAWNTERLQGFDDELHSSAPGQYLRYIRI